MGEPDHSRGTPVHGLQMAELETLQLLDELELEYELEEEQEHQHDSQQPQQRGIPSNSPPWVASTKSDASFNPEMDQRWGTQLLQKRMAPSWKGSSSVSASASRCASPRRPLGDVTLNRPPSSACDTKDWFRQRRLDLLKQQAAKAARSRMNERGFDVDTVSSYIEHMEQMLAVCELAAAAHRHPR